MNVATPTKAAPAYSPGSFALRNTWFPLAHLAQIRRTMRRSLHGQPVYLWYESAVLRASQRPPEDRRHRSAAGKSIDDLGPYPVVARYGYAWVWYGDPSAASESLLPKIPFLPETGLPRHMQTDVVFDCSYELVCENLLDVTHADFLHTELTGDPFTEEDRITVESTSETVTMVRTALGRRVPRFQKPLAKGADVQDARFHVHVHVRSGVCLIHADFNPGPSIRLLNPICPEMPGRASTAGVFDIQHCSALTRYLWPKTAHMVARQDNWALREQERNFRKPAPSRDLSSRFDAAGLRYRMVYQKLVARQMQGDYAYLSDGDPGRDVVEPLGLHRTR